MITKVPDTGWSAPIYYRSIRVIDGRYKLILDDYPCGSEVGVDVTFEDAQRATYVPKTFIHGDRQERLGKAEAFLLSKLPADCGVDRTLPSFYEAFVKGRQRPPRRKTKD